MPDDELTTQVVAEMVKQRGGDAYDEGLAPAVSEGGKALQTLGKTINMVLSPIRRLALKVEAGETLFQRELEEKLNQIPEDRLIEPNPAIARPLLEGGISNDDNPELREMFTNLLASTMDRESAGQVHPSFVYTLQQLTADEAKILLFMREEYTLGTRNYLTFLIDAIPRERGLFGDFTLGPKGFPFGHLLTSAAGSGHNPTYFQNLVRLELATIEQREKDSDEIIRELEKDYSLERSRWQNDVRQRQVNVKALSTLQEVTFDLGLDNGFWILEYIKLTDYGYSFLEACSPWEEYEWPEPTDQ